MKYFRSIFFFLFLLTLTSKAQVVINEYSCSNLNGIMSNLGTYEDWIELYNTSSTPVNLNNYYLSNKKTNITKWKLGNVTIAGNGFLRIWASGQNINTGPNLHANFSLTQCKVENIIFSDPSAVVLDSLTIRPAKITHSRGRTTNGASTWSVFYNPTPGTSNTNPKSEYVSAPVMNVAPGFYAGTQLVTITCSTPSTTIHYTTNGTTPTAASPTYTAPVSIATTKVLRAIAISSVPNTPSSFVTSNTYFIGTPHTVSVVSIFGDSANYLLAGNTSTPEIEMEYFDSSGTYRTFGHGQANKHGNDSWSYPQRGIDFISFDEYGYSDVLKHRFFNSKSRSEFQRVILKAAANDNYPFECPAAGNPNAWGDPTLFDGAHIRDAYVHTVAQKAGMHLDGRTWAPMVMYVNGQYWGVYDLREKVDDKDFTKYYYGSKTDSLQMLKTWGTTWSAYGGTQAQNDWNTLSTFITSNNMAIPANYNYVDSLYNIKSLADYVILNSYAVTTDWLNWNTEWWRGTNVGCAKRKWRYCLWDEDATFHHYINYTGVPSTDANANPCDPESLGDPGGEGHVPILNALMQNPTFKQYYVMRYFDLINTGLSCTRMTQILDSMVAVITPEMSKQILRWGGTVAAWQQNVSDLRNFILQRCDSVTQHFGNCYNTTGPFLLKVNVDPPNSGTVDVNSTHLTSFVWSGLYPGNINILLAEHPNPGFCFSHWTLKNNTPLPNNLDSLISVNLLTTDSIVAHFDSCVITPPQVVVKVNVDPPGAGTVYFNSMHLTSFVWSGSYAPGTTVTLAQVPNPNFCFSHWSLVSDTASPSNLDSLISVHLVNSDSIVAHYDANPKPTITPVNPKFCVGDSAQLTASTALGYTWTPTAGLSCVNCPDPFAHPSSTTVYTVTVLNIAPNCANKGTQTVTVIPYANASFVDTVINPGSLPADVHFSSTSTQASTFSWNFGSGFSTNGLSTSYSYSVAGTYSVTMIAINSSGCNDTITRIIVISDTAGIIMPNVFTPNGDGINDYFQPIVHNVSEFSCTILDRWGKVIYEFSGVNDKWSGQNSHGATVPDGTYYYIVKAKDGNAKSYNFKGFLQLVR